MVKNLAVLAVDLGQSGCRIRLGDFETSTDRGKLLGESPLDALSEIFPSFPDIKAETVALSCSGFYGKVDYEEKYLELCNKFFGATSAAVIDDGLAGFVGALDSRSGVVLSIGGGVVAVGGHQGNYSHRDGLGSTFGDEGGGFWLGKLAITKALGITQGRGDDLEMADYFAAECMAYYDLQTRNGAEAATLAINTAKKVLDAADAGVSTATAIVDEGAYLLAQTVTAAWLGCGGKKNGSPEIVIQGGPAHNESYVTKIALEISSKLPFAVFVESSGDNLDGAQWIANNMEIDSPPLLKWARA